MDVLVADTNGIMAAKRILIFMRCLQWTAKGQKKGRPLGAQLPLLEKEVQTLPGGNFRPAGLTSRAREGWLVGIPAEYRRARRKAGFPALQTGCGALVTEVYLLLVPGSEFLALQADGTPQQFRPLGVSRYGLEVHPPTGLLLQAVQVDVVP
jgi:hypothetical protein